MYSLQGRTLGPYRIGERIGIGGMGVVYRAYDPGLDRYVAIKLLHEYLSHNPEFAARFQFEARNVAKLRHPNILPIHGYSEEEGVSYFVMDLVEGGTLQDLMGEPMETGQAVPLVVQLARALQYAHRQGIVHRDVKPANVLMVYPDWPLLSDFGIARVMEQTAALTHSGSAFFGSPHYMAPEQARGERISPATDQYALGIVLYEMLTGKPPYHADTPQALVYQHIHSPPPLPRERNARVSEDMERAMLRALEKDPVARFPDMAAFASAIQSTSGKTVSIRELRDLPEPGAAAMPGGEPRLDTERIECRDVASAARSLPTPVRGTTLEELQRRRVPPTWAMGLGSLAALVVAIAVAFLVFHSPSSNHSPVHAASLALSVVGKRHGNLYGSGQTVTLRWGKVAPADVYQLQVATWPSDPSDAEVFRRPLLSELTERNSESIRIVGYQLYYWRVRAKANGVWGRYTSSEHFTVARPTIGEPKLLRPRNGSLQRAGAITLCWSTIKGAVGFRLQVSDLHFPPLKATCKSMHLRPRTYTWKVAALVQGVRVYVGAYSPAWRFAIEALPTPTPTPTATATSAPTPTSSPTATSTPTAKPTRAPQRATPTTAPTSPRQPTSSPTPTTPPRPIRRTCSGSIARVHKISRGLVVQPPSQAARRAIVGTCLFIGYTLRTRQGGQASIIFPDGSVLYMNQRTVIVLKSAHLTLVKRGEVSQTLKPGSNHQVKTQAGTANSIG